MTTWREINALGFKAGQTMATLSKILKDFYLPSITAQLNKESILLTMIGGGGSGGALMREKPVPVLQGVWVNEKGYLAKSPRTWGELQAA